MTLIISKDCKKVTRIGKNIIICPDNPQSICGRHSDRLDVVTVGFVSCESVEVAWGNSPDTFIQIGMKNE